MRSGDSVASDRGQAFILTRLAVLNHSDGDPSASLRLANEATGGRERVPPPGMERSCLVTGGADQVPRRPIGIAAFQGDDAIVVSLRQAAMTGVVGRISALVAPA